MTPTESVECAPLTSTQPEPELGRGDTTDRSLLRAATIGPTSPPQAVALLATEKPVVAAAERYRTREVLGAGGMGEVRLCYDEAIGREVALKTLLPTVQRIVGAEQRFLREVRVQGQLEHPSTVPVYDLGADADGSLFFTMRRVRGLTLASILSGLARGDAAMAASYSKRKLLGAFSRVCLAVDYAHARGVLHRDLKPSNIMLGDFGEVYVLDWGIARLSAERAIAAPVNAPGAAEASPSEVVGTVGYMSPEQLFGLSELQDARTDVYALGAILFEILTLRRLHEGNTFEARVESTRATVAAHPMEVAAEVPPELDAACARAAARDRAARLASARELSDAVERYLDGDRDLARRRELSEERVAAALAQLAAGSASDRSDQDAAAARAGAVREVTAALALDPENAGARQLLISLFVEPPARVPPAVSAAMAASSHRNFQQFARYGAYGIASWLVTLPMVATIGVRCWLPIIATTVLCLCTLLATLYVRRHREHSAARLLSMTAIALATIASASCFLGPFVLVPQIASVVTLWMAFQCRTLRERYAVAAMGSFAVALPFLCELLGIFPPAYAFENGNLTLLARAIVLSPRAIIPLLLYASVSSVALSALFLGTIRRLLTAAEQKLFLHAWHLRQVLPADASGVVQTTELGKSLS